MLRGQASFASGDEMAGLPAPSAGSMGGAVVLTDAEGRVTFWNPAAELLYGHRPAGAARRQRPGTPSTGQDRKAAKKAQETLGAGSAFSKLFDKKAWAAVSVATTLVGAGETVEPLLTIGRRGDGSSIDLELHPSAMRDGSGTMSGVCWMLVDITAELRDPPRREGSRHQLQSRFEQGPTAEAIVDLDGRLVCVNNALCQLVGRNRDELEGTLVATLIPPSEGAAASRLDTMLISGPETDTWEHLVLHGGGQSLPTQIRAALLREPDGSLCGLAFSLHDPLPQQRADAVVAPGQDAGEVALQRTERATVERALHASETRRQAIADTALEGIWAIEVSGRTLYANEKLATVLGIDLAAIYERNAAEVLSPDDGFFADQLRHRAERGAEVYEILYQHPDGAPRQLRLSASPLQDDGPTGSLAMITDVTAAHVAEEKLRVRALHDELTGLANRSLLDDRLEHALARRERLSGGPVAVIFADIDGFKLVNDSWGHSAGDALLVKVAERLSAGARIDDTVARFGGDEFVIVCEDTDETQARRVADDLLEALNAPFEVDGHRVYVSASIGLAITPPESAEELLRFADAAMHEAKGRGRGRVHVFDVATADEAAERLQMANDLREALQRKQLTLDYQPVIDLLTGKLVGVEALARWTHPRYGAVPPARFVAVAEATGLAPMLGQWALERAMQELDQVRRTVGAHVRVAVNISARHLADPDFEATVLGAMTAHQVPRDALLLEITESAVMGDPEQVRKVLAHLRTRGVESAIDDFGTGYSSLGHLNTLSVDMLKIDRSFIDRMTKDSDSLAIVTSIVDLARIMNLVTVAEGVETREQLTILRQLGCSRGQGFLWSKALPLAKLRGLVGALPGSRFDVTLAGTAASPRPSLPEDQVTVAHGLQHIMRMNKSGASLTTIAAALNAEGFRTPRGLRWHQATVGRVISDCAYPHLWGPDPD